MSSPFKNYSVYKVWHKNEGRWYAQLVSSNHRTTISWARYIMSLHIGRKLSKEEQVDHINENKSDDRLENLQVLTRKQNNSKHVKSTGKTAKWRYLLCPVCGSCFSRRSHRIDGKIKQGKVPCCSRQCGGKYSRKNKS